MFVMPRKAAAGRGRRRDRRAGLLAAALAGAGVLVAGCSGGLTGPAVAGAATPSASASAAPSGAAAEALAYATCMRSHGVRNFPDPTVKNGSVGFDFSGASVDQNSATYQSARQACQNLRGGGTSSPGSQNLAQELKFAKCMRSHGVPGFPDPNKNGGFSGSTSINGGSATFQNAQATCMRISGLGADSGSSS